MSAEHPTTYRPDIDGLRAIAVLGVVIFHAGSKKLTGGFVGVDVFFVISGYLISGIILRGLESGTFSLTDFYRRRIKRIFPALVLVLTCTWIFGWFALLNGEFQSLGKHIAASSLFLSNFLLWGETGYFDTAAEMKPLLHLWSLGIEEQFYLLWPFLLLLAWRGGVKLGRVVLAILAVSFVVNIVAVGISQAMAFFLPFSRFWELMLGGLLASMEVQRARRHQDNGAPFLSLLLTPSAGGPTFANAKAWIGAAMLGAALFLLDRTQPYPGWAALLPALGTAMLIAAGMGAWFNRTVLSGRWLVFVGLISYPLYLWHWSLISLVRIVEWGKPERSMINACVALSFVLAWATYVLVERPLRFGRYTTRIRNVLIPSVLLAAMAILGVLGWLTYRTEGFPTRGPVTEVGDIGEKLAQLKQDVDSDPECDAYIGPGRNFTYCRLGAATRHPAVAVIGDSHAHASFPGFASYFAARGAGAILLASAGCPPWLNTTFHTQGEARQKQRCPAEVGRIFDIVAADKNIETVILVSRGPFYIYEEGFGAVERGSKWKFDYRDVAGTTGLEKFSSGLEDSIRRLTSSGKRIYFLLQVPELGFDPESCFGRRVHFSKVERKCAVARSEVDNRQAEYRAAVRALESKYANFHVLDPWPLLCNAGECKAIVDNQLIYSDDDHLSIAGSQFVVSGMGASLAGIVPTSP